MPTYDYRCDSNAQTVEVKHSMNHLVQTWGELCELAGIDPGDTPANTPVKKLATGGQVVKKSSLGDSAAPACPMSNCCGGVCPSQ